MVGFVKVGLEVMMKVLKYNRILRELDISFNWILVEGVVFLVNGLRENDVF